MKKYKGEAVDYVKVVAVNINPDGLVSVKIQKNDDEEQTAHVPGLWSTSTNPEDWMVIAIQLIEGNTDTVWVGVPK